MVCTWTHGIDKDSWHRQGLMVLTTTMILTLTHGIELVLLNHTRTRGPSITRMRDFFLLNKNMQRSSSRTVLPFSNIGSQGSWLDSYLRLGKPSEEKICFC